MIKIQVKHFGKWRTVAERATLEDARFFVAEKVLGHTSLKNIQFIDDTGFPLGYLEVIGT